MRAALALLLAGIGTAQAAAPDPAALPREWALAYATNDGARAAAPYTEDARLWSSVSREQTVGSAAITA
ncbi:hypothetical protein KTR66_08135 [Roseococcus sp. SDR]|uniref:hypothetical protein n=1 Tax=Roseococcus sp. SDR TaxID=2835532 RepID=UPI001BCEAED7|nr:hypothetical protein [Roseococcus sp. SDR]MBS7789959.1 hypothetical protein [Roseococcus sp. SDR]MBV1845273.1 hypothetical protein [Roseococcus sp. SDR]